MRIAEVTEIGATPIVDTHQMTEKEKMAGSRSMISDNVQDPGGFDPVQ